METLFSNLNGVEPFSGTLPVSGVSPGTLSWPATRGWRPSRSAQAVEPERHSTISSWASIDSSSSGPPSPWVQISTSLLGGAEEGEEFEGKDDTLQEKLIGAACSAGSPCGRNHSGSRSRSVLSGPTDPTHCSSCFLPSSHSALLGFGDQRDGSTLLMFFSILSCAATG